LALYLKDGGMKYQCVPPNRSPTFHAKSCRQQGGEGVSQKRISVPTVNFPSWFSLSIMSLTGH
jgi:hypothetical protein